MIYWHCSITPRSHEINSSRTSCVPPLCPTLHCLRASLRQLLRNCQSARDASRFLLIEDPQPPLLQLCNRFSPPEVGRRRLSPMVHVSPTHPRPLLRLRLESAKVARPKEDLLGSHNQPQKTYDWTGWWPPPVQHFNCCSPQFQWGASCPSSWTPGGQ